MFYTKLLIGTVNSACQTGKQDKKIIDRSAVCPFCRKSHHKGVLIVYNLCENKLCGETAVFLWCRHADQAPLGQCILFSNLNTYIYI